MTEFMSFDSLDDQIEFMRRQEEEANKHIHPKQKAVGYGDCWIRFWLMPGTNTWVAIFGKAIDPGYYANKIEHATDEEDKAEWEYEQEVIADAWTRGYVYGWAYSVIEPEGEPGSTHMVNLWPIPEVLFDMAGVVHWVTDDLPDDGKVLLEQAYQEYREHVLSEAGLL